MSEIIPFRGIRYKKGDLGRLICPPYDVINDEGRKRLLALSKHNFVRIESPRGLGISNKSDTAAAVESAKDLKAWLKSGVLMRETIPAFYVYSQEFCLHGRRFKRTGFLAALRVDKKDVIGHERISQKPIFGRLELMRRTGGANTSPIFCLFDDRNGAAGRLIDKLSTKTKVSRAFCSEFEDEAGIRHRITALTGEPAVSDLRRIIEKKRVLIADGHHRYHTARIFRDEMASAGKMKERYNYVLAHLCRMDDSGVAILATHRVVRAGRGIRERVERYFNLVRWEGKKDPVMVVYHNGNFFDMKFKKKSDEKRVSGYLNIPAMILAETVLKDVPPEDIYYTHDINEAVRTAQKESGYAFLITPPSIKTVYELSAKGVVMPTKTTYFYPKAPAGLVVYDE
jgi:uncharacterized protein (DUF1015 family)